MASTAPFAHSTVSVGTSQAPLVAIPAGIKSAKVKVHNNDATKIVYIGDNTVTASGATQGFPVLPNVTEEFTVAPNATLYAIASGALTSVSVIWSAIS